MYYIVIDKISKGIQTNPFVIIGLSNGDVVHAITLDKVIDNNWMHITLANNLNSEHQLTSIWISLSQIAYVSFDDGLN